MIAILAATLLAQSAPDRIILTWYDDPATSAAITWRTQDNLGTPQVEIALAKADPQFVKNAKATNASTQSLILPESRGYFHTARLSALTPDTLYAYRVGNGTVWSEWIQFKTASDQPKPFKFIYFGDAQNDVKSLWSRVIRQAYKDAPYADFMLHAGDLCNIPHKDSEWAEWFYAGGWIHASIPSLAIPGNHEYGGFNGGSRRLAVQWRPQFEFPLNGIKELPETNYYVDFQGARIIGLDTNTMLAEQAVWLDKVLAENPHQWAFVTFHHPVFSTARDDSKQRQDLLRPILEKHKVPLVLQGHDHTYGRRNVPTGVTQLNEETGTVYVVSVSGPKMYNVRQAAKETMQKTGQNKQLYQIISVNGSRLKYEAFLTTGELFDSFELQKNPDGTNIIIHLPEEL